MRTQAVVIHQELHQSLVGLKRCSFDLTLVPPVPRTGALCYLEASSYIPSPNVAGTPLSNKMDLSVLQSSNCKTSFITKQTWGLARRAKNISILNI